MNEQQELRRAMPLRDDLLSDYELLNELDRHPDSQVRELVRRFRLASADQAATPTAVAPVYRHRKTGGEYAFVAVAHLQVQNEALDMEQAVIYRSLEDGAYWVRPVKEFMDGRFEPVHWPDQHPQAAAAAQPFTAVWHDEAERLLGTLANESDQLQRSMRAQDLRRFLGVQHGDRAARDPRATCVADAALPNWPWLRGADVSVLSKAYDFAIDINGNLCGLVAGDMGFEETGIQIDMTGWRVDGNLPGDPVLPSRRGEASHREGYIATVTELRSFAQRAPYVNESNVLEAASLPEGEMRKRIIVNRDWHGHVAHCLDGITQLRVMPGGAPDGCWSHKEIRAVVLRLVESHSLTWEDDCFGRPKRGHEHVSGSMVAAAAGEGS